MRFVSAFNLTQRRRGLAKVVIFHRRQVSGLWQNGRGPRLLRLRPASTQRAIRSHTSDFVTQTSESIHASDSAALLSAATAHLRVSDRYSWLNMNLLNMKVE